MIKKEVQQRVLQNGKPLDFDKFSWDENTNTFSTTESNLVIDFFGILHCTFKTGSHCTFKTGSCCTFKTGSHCILSTGAYCTFDTLSSCTFKTGAYCVFVRRDVFEFFEIPVGITIKLNGYQAKGYSVIEELKEFQVTRTVKAKTQEEAESLVTTKQDNN